MKLLVLTFLFLSHQTLALIPFEDAVSPELVTSARALAMGNAYMSKVDDGMSAFYNPAGLGTVRGLQLHPINFHAETNDGFLKVTGKGAFADTISNYTKSFDTTALRQLHVDNPGNLSHARLNLFPNVTYRGVTIGWMYAQQNRSRLKTAASDFEVSQRTDWGPVMALNLPLKTLNG